MKNPSNQSEYFKILKEHTFKNETGVTAEDFSRMLSEVRIHDLPELYERNKDFGGLYHFLTSLRSFLDRNDLLVKDFTPYTIYEKRYIMKVLEESRNGKGEDTVR